MAEAVIASSLKLQPPPPELARQPLVSNQRPIGWISDAVAGVAPYLGSEAARGLESLHREGGAKRVANAFL